MSGHAPSMFRWITLHAPALASWPPHLALGEVFKGQPLAPFELDRLLAQRFRLLGRTGIVLMVCAGLDMAA